MGKSPLKSIVLGLGFSVLAIVTLVGAIFLALYLFVAAFGEDHPDTMQVSATAPVEAILPSATASAEASLPLDNSSPPLAAATTDLEEAQTRKVVEAFEKSAAMAVERYPDAAKEGSPLYRRMAEIHAALEAAGDPMVNDPNKPLLIAERAAKILELESTDKPAVSKSTWTREESLERAKELYPDLNDPASELFKKCREISAGNPNLANSFRGPLIIAQKAAEAIANERSQHRFARREQRQSRISPVDPRRLAAAGLTEFANANAATAAPQASPRRQQVPENETWELRRTGDYFTDQYGNTHRITNLPGRENYQIGDEWEVRGNSAFGPDGQTYRVRRDSFGRTLIQP